MIDKFIRNRLQATWQKLHAHTVPQDTFDELIQAYSSPERFYHNLVHIEDCLALFDRTNALAIHPEEVELAIWFHDGFTIQEEMTMSRKARNGLSQSLINLVLAKQL